MEGPWGQGLEPGAVLSPPGEYVALEPGLFCAAVPEISCQGEASKEDANADADFLRGGMDAASVPVAGLRSSAGSLTHFDLFDLVSEPSPRVSNPSPERGSPQHDDNQEFPCQVIFMVHDLKCEGPGTFLSRGVSVLRM